jgi:hypothetical protein
MSVSVLNGDQYLIYLNSSDTFIGEGPNNGTTDDSNFTTDIRPMSLSPNHEWVVGVVDVNYYNPNKANTAVDPAYLPTSEPVAIYSDIGIFVRSGSDTTNVLYITNPTPTLTQLYIGERNKATPIAWRPLQNRNITNIKVKFETLFSKQPIKWNGLGIRGYNSLTLCIKKVK